MITLQSSDIMQPESQAEKLYSKSVDLTLCESTAQEAEFRKQRKIYLAERQARKKEVRKTARLRFQSSSSEDEPVLPQQSHTRAAKSNPLVEPNHPQQSGISPIRDSMVPGARKESAGNAAKTPPRFWKVPVQVASRNGQQNWRADYLLLYDNIFELQGKSYPIIELSKIKLNFLAGPSNHLKLKLSMKQEELFLYGALSCSNDCCLEDYYFLFAKLIGLRMQLYGHKVSVGKCQPAQNCYFEGLLLRSQLFGWEERFARVDKTGLHVYKKDKTTVTLDVSFGAVKELWTRFQVQDNMLVIKLLQQGSKQELGIPYTDYLGTVNWLYWLYQLARKTCESP